jgi:hypothetical protein
MALAVAVRVSGLHAKVWCGVLWRVMVVTLSCLNSDSTDNMLIHLAGSHRAEQ